MQEDEVNLYTARWFATFLETVPGEQTERELAFIMRALPLRDYRRILDLACGPGRHAVALAHEGYHVTGWDRDAAAIAAARFAAAANGAANVSFDVRDVRSLSAADGPFDAVISMWSSFGYFDDAGNRELLQNMAAVLRPNGRMLLDLYDVAFFRGREGERLHARGGTAVRERIALEGNRLRVELRYGGGESDRFEWQLFTVEEWRDLARSAALDCIQVCSDFDPTVQAAGERPRMQVLLEKR